MSSNSFYSGKFVVRVPPVVHQRLSQLARNRGISLNQICLERLDNDLSDGGGGRGLVSDLYTEVVHRLLEKGVPVLGLVLFGSVARGEARDTSDIDLLIVIDRSKNLNKSLYALWDECVDQIKVEPDLRHRLSPQFVHIPEDPLDAGSIWFECAIDGVVLFDPRLSVSMFLAKIRDAVVGNKITRSSAHGHYYWVKNAK